MFSSDIADGVDYLDAKSAGLYKAIITNPPFSLAEQFIRKAVAEAPVVAMLLKATYFHAGSRVALFRECPPTAVLAMAWRPAMCPERGKSPIMDFIWAVWIKGVRGTEYCVLPKPKGSVK